MSTPFSRKMQGVATRLLSKYGSTVTLVRAGVKTWDELTGEYIFSESSELPLRSVPVPVNASLVDGATIHAGDMIVRADYSVQPTLEDKILFNGAQWSIVAIDTKIVNDDIIAYFVQVRK
jgi:hypothetical protein